MPASFSSVSRRMTVHGQVHYDRQIASWLLFCAAVIFGMILLGGLTRLTNSGLSMVEWKPLVGVIPPLSEQAWMETFDKYKQFPEYQKINHGMEPGRVQVDLHVRVPAPGVGATDWRTVSAAHVVLHLQAPGARGADAPVSGVVFYGWLTGAVGLVHGEKWPGE